MSYKKRYEELKIEFEQYKLESIKWSIEDFMDPEDEYYKITKEEAQNALEDMIEHHDCELGITWDTINNYKADYGTLKD